MCQCGAEVIRKQSQRVTAKFYCSCCATAWRYCTGCYEMKLPLEQAEIICGEKCEAKVDSATDTWFCKGCWKISILEKQPASSSRTTRHPGDVMSNSYRPKPPKPPA